ncbi:MAG TPA: nitrate reductase molybdenum cofactor assembly chaperone [Solirubrobacteraceae bacterium]|nr:nitrate reductase molybdenum cofactor assembly chaperone [Solirubrobacteraceae bacterium]
MSRRADRRQSERAHAYKLCSLALQYPDDEIIAGRSKLATAAAELPRGPIRESLDQFFAWFEHARGLELAQHYVQTFDLHKRTGLYVTFYSHGDRRERGLVLLRLRQLYRAAGLPTDEGELPDYLPLMLEFAAAADPERGGLVLREHRPALEVIRLSLHEQESPYRHVLDAVCELVGGLTALERLSLDRLLAQGPPQELVGLEPLAPPEVMPSVEARR